VRAVLFDLDDTLYPEIEFVHSGFRAVAAAMAETFGGTPEAVAAALERTLEAEGRGAVFDRALARRNAWSEGRVLRALWIYRTHAPSISLWPSAVRVLERLRRSGIRTGVLTDGMGSVQRRKIEALGLDALVDAVVCSDELGPGRGKPHGAGYVVLLETLGIGPRDAAYVGNDAAKDFVWPNRSGMLSVELRRPGFAPLEVPETHRAKRIVSSLDELEATVAEALHED